MKTIRVILALLAVVLTFSMCFAISISAEETTDYAAESDAAAASTDNGEAEEGQSVTGTKAMASAFVVGIAVAAGAIAMGVVISKSAESMARQPEAAGKVNSAMMLGLVFIETLIIYALIVAILIIFVI